MVAEAAPKLDHRTMYADGVSTLNDHCMNLESLTFASWYQVTLRESVTIFTHGRAQGKCFSGRLDRILRQKWGKMKQQLI